MGKGRSRRDWIERHLSDPFVKQATAAGYRSRAAYKLIEIDDQEKLLRPGRLIVDLGAAPGGWSQVAAQRVRSTLSGSTSTDGAGRGRVIALDLLEMEPIDGVQLIRGDFLETEVLERLESCLDGQRAWLVMSDMAPNLSGMRLRDQANAEALAEVSVDFALRWLAPGGALLMKVFEGAYVAELRKTLRQSFQKLSTKKPAASRDSSSELYLLARGFNGIV
ncbi:MAG: RlmE family RNA methyltransferase [Gammaproteobacteria bacterium]|nr:RlmE family RNA methyltransferase [Gammaproteobacteria bacterium]